MRTSPCEDILAQRLTGRVRLRLEGVAQTEWRENNIPGPAAPQIKIPPLPTAAALDSHPTTTITIVDTANLYTHFIIRINT